MREHSTMPKINAGSMADIAFLLLSFFLVTTVIPNDKGIARRLPSLCENPPCSETLNERNVLRIQLNAQGDLMVENDLTSITELKKILIDFIDNNGDQSCNYCNGIGDKWSSDNPSIAVISLSSHRQSAYKDYVAVQLEVTKAYAELRQRYRSVHFGKQTNGLSNVEIQVVKDAYPYLISEAELD